MTNKIIAVGPHYKTALKSRGIEDLHPLQLFLKPFSSIIFNDSTIIIEPFMRNVVAEGEIALLLKKDLKYVEVADIILEDVIEAVSIGLDITLTDNDAFCHGKIYDTFTPLCDFKQINPYLLEYKVFLKGKLMQIGHVEDMTLSFESILSYCSKYFSLNKGDIILTGTPAGTFKIVSGDIITIESNLMSKHTFKVE